MKRKTSPSLTNRFQLRIKQKLLYYKSMTENTLVIVVSVVRIFYVFVVVNIVTIIIITIILICYCINTTTIVTIAVDQSCCNGCY